MKTNQSFAKICWGFIVVGIFSIAMGALESIVVIYLRQIYYPQGFDFPLTLFSPPMLSMEWLREAATIVMLAAVGIIAGKNNLQKFAYFLYSFAIWDIFYYVWLKILLNWPSSFLTWDVLFLIPIPWTGPVLAPVIASLTMILLGGTIIYLQGKGFAVKLNLFEWGLTFAGAFIILCSFLWDYSQVIIQWYLLDFKDRGNACHLFELISSYTPIHYHWSLFILGEIFILCALVLMIRRTKSQTPCP